MSVNKAILVGEISDGPTHSNGDGWQLSRFTVKVVETFVRKDGTAGEAPTWIKCTAWNALADKLHAGIPKGTIVAVSGKIENRKYTDKEGIEKRDFSIRAETVEVISYSQEPALKGQTDGPFEQSQSDVAMF